MRETRGGRVAGDPASSERTSLRRHVSDIKQLRLLQSRRGGRKAALERGEAIVILNRKEATRLAPAVAPYQDTLGVMLPILPSTICSWAVP